MVDVAGTFTEVSRQRWAMLNPLLAGDSHQSGMFANVERHNGIEACRRIAEPINEDKAHVRRDLLATVTNPKGETSMDNIETAVENWNTNIRLFVAKRMNLAPRTWTSNLAPLCRYRCPCTLDLQPCTAVSFLHRGQPHVVVVVVDVVMRGGDQPHVVCCCFVLVCGFWTKFIHGALSEIYLIPKSKFKNVSFVNMFSVAAAAAVGCARDASTQ